LKCEQTICTIGKEDKLPSEYEAPYLGTEVAWEGFAKVPAAHLKAYAAQMPQGAQMPPGAKLMGGAQPVPPGGIKTIKSDMGVNVTAEVVGMQYRTPQAMVMAPSILTNRDILGKYAYGPYDFLKEQAQNGGLSTR
jgi:hypothetical protein